MKFIVTVAASLVFVVPTANAHLVTKPKSDKLKAVYSSQSKNLEHSRYVCNNGRNKTKVWHCTAVKWLKKEQHETYHRLNPVVSWKAIQIYYATLIAKSASIDPWPNCPDPYFNGASWEDTVACENDGNWLDSPGFYRCGLQFHPNWERHYGRKFCP